MKKILCIIICILSLGGCGKVKPKDVLKEPLDFGGFESVVHTKVNNVEICAKAVYTPYESLSFAFSEPDVMSSTEIICNSGEYTLKTGGLAFTLSGDKMPFTMMCKSLEDCLNKVKGAAPEYDSQSDCNVYRYNSGEHCFKLFVNRQTNCFEKLSADEKDLIVFENFVFSE